MIYLNLAFDHELSLGGGVRSYEENLLAPTRALLDLAATLEVPITLFTDVLCGIRFRECEPAGFGRDFEQQLQAAAGTGQDVQLHLHPHWLDSRFENGRFVPCERYSLHDFRHSDEWGGIDGIVGMGVDYLEEVVRPVNSAYEVLAFRAGGLVIEPSTHEIAESLASRGVRYDSSVAPGYRFETQISKVDFSRVPSSPNWPLESSAITEIPIATAPRNTLNNLPALARRILRRSEAPCAGGFPLYDASSGLLDKAARLFPRSAWFLSFDLYWASGPYLVSLLDRYLAGRDCGEGEDIFVSTLSHPKSMGAGGLRVMEEFVGAARTKYGDQLRFCTFPDLPAIPCGDQPPVTDE